MEPSDTYFDLFLGYTAFWVIIAAYALLLMKEQRGLKKLLDRLSPDGSQSE